MPNEWRWAWSDLLVAMSDVHAIVCLAAVRLLFILVSSKLHVHGAAGELGQGAESGDGGVCSLR